MIEEEIKLKNYTYEQRKWIREQQDDCNVCRCYGVENCGEHSIILKQFKS